MLLCLAVPHPNFCFSLISLSGYRRTPSRSTLHSPYSTMSRLSSRVSPYDGLEEQSTRLRVCPSLAYDPQGSSGAGGYQEASSCGPAGYDYVFPEPLGCAHSDDYYSDMYGGADNNRRARHQQAVVDSETDRYASNSYMEDVVHDPNGTSGASQQDYYSYRSPDRYHNNNQPPSSLTFSRHPVMRSNNTDVVSVNGSRGSLYSSSVGDNVAGRSGCRSRVVSPPSSSLDQSMPEYYGRNRRNTSSSGSERRAENPVLMANNHSVDSLLCQVMVWNVSFCICDFVRRNCYFEAHC